MLSHLKIKSLSCWRSNFIGRHGGGRFYVPATFQRLFQKPSTTPVQKWKPVVKLDKSNLIIPSKSLDNIGGWWVGAILESAGALSFFVHLGDKKLVIWKFPFGFGWKPGCPWKGRRLDWSWRWHCHWAEGVYNISGGNCGKPIWRNYRQNYEFW